ncbi:hypothetical protein MYX75_08275 [Acidobacteria bacterium AH-259-A15]|nr:hypothetical protein [Acidobacteria bacterium AH-259-A15]
MKAIKVLLSFWVVLFLVDASQAQVPLRTEFFFPHIVDAQVDEDDELKTIIVLDNPKVASPVTVTLTIVDQDGVPVIDGVMQFRCLEVGGPCTSIGLLLGPADLIDITIPAGGLFQVMTSRVAPDTTFVGYGKVTVTAGPAISGMAVFGEFESEEKNGQLEVEIEGQAAVEATGRMTKFAVTDFRKNELEGELPGGVEFEFESESATGLAVVNLDAAATTTITLTEFDASGMKVGTGVMGGTICVFDNTTKECSFTLGPEKHRSFFFSEAITVPEDMVVGTVIVESSSTDVTAVALKFDDESDNGETRFEFTVAPVTQLP